MTSLALRRSHLVTGGLWTIVLSILLGAPCTARGEADGSSPASDDADVQVCADCHPDTVTKITASPHALLDDPSWMQAASVRSGHGELQGSCASCHGDASQHLDDLSTDQLFNFSEAAPKESSQRCMSCHALEHPGFGGSAHARAGLSCIDCHAPHGDEPERSMTNALAGRPSQTCVECHAGVAATFAFSEHHDLEEGAIECTSCHDPHARESRAMLSVIKQRQCTSCHSDKEGPWIFEHAASRVEGCVSCHTPHGSPNRNLLTFVQEGELCYSCHAGVPGFHTRFTVDDRCTSCHSQIHGSNLHPGFLQ